MSRNSLPEELEKMNKEELIALLKQLHAEEGEKSYHPDSMLAMAMASPQEARKIAWKAVHPFAKFMMFFVFGLIFFIFMFLVFILSA